MNPNTDPKSKLSLSAGHDVDRCIACSPDDYPPYERVPPPPLRVRLRAAAAFGVILVILLLGSFQGVQASCPPNYFACVVPHPTPHAGGGTGGIRLQPTPAPARTLPPTDTVR